VSIFFPLLRARRDSFDSSGRQGKSEEHGEGTGSRGRKEVGGSEEEREIEEISAASDAASYSSMSQPCGCDRN
jgi:hypothetical protein